MKTAIRSLVTLACAAASAVASAYHWQYNHTSVTYIDIGSGGAHGAIAAPNSHGFYYSCYGSAYADSNGPTYSSSTLGLYMVVSIYVDYVKDSPSDPDGPDTAGGAGTASEGIYPTFLDGNSYVNTSGSTVTASAQGHATGLAANFTYSWGGQGDYPGGGTTGTSGQVFPFVKNTSSASGTHVAHKVYAVPSGSLLAVVNQTNPSDYGEAFACVTVSGTVTLDTIDGPPVH